MKKTGFSGFKPGDLIIFMAVLFCGLFLLFKSGKKNGSTVYVQAGSLRYEYSLSENGVHSVKGPLGETVFEILDGRVHIIASPCPNKTCIHQGFDDTLVCLPNNVTIWIDKGEVDAISK